MEQFAPQAPHKETAIVRKYLMELEDRSAAKPQKARGKTKAVREPDLVEAELEQVKAQTPARSLGRLQLAQRRLDLEAELIEARRVHNGEGTDLEDLFVSVAASYSERKGLTYEVWLEVGVPAEVLERAGISH